MRIVRAAFLLTVYVARASRNSRSAIASCSSTLSPETCSGSTEELIWMTKEGRNPSSRGIARSFPGDRDRTLF